MGDFVQSRLPSSFGDRREQIAQIDDLSLGIGDLDTMMAEAERMLESANADTTVARFFREWTRTRRLTQADKSIDVFPTFDADVAASINESFDRFVVDAVRQGDAFEDLIGATDIWVDATTAELVGVDAPPDGQWAEVSVDPNRPSLTGKCLNPATRRYR